MVRWLPAGTLVRLALRWMQLGGAGVAELTRSPVLPRLRRLDLSVNAVGLAGATALAATPFAGLDGLTLAGNPVGQAGLASLLGSAWAGGLRELGLAGCGLGDAAAGLIAASPQLRGLRRLDLGLNPLTDAAVGALTASPHLDRWLELEVRGTAVTGCGMIRLRDRFLLAS